MFTFAQDMTMNVVNKWLTFPVSFFTQSFHFRLVVGEGTTKPSSKVVSPTDWKSGHTRSVQTRIIFLILILESQLNFKPFPPLSLCNYLI
jgi:hypothetical protein